MRMSTSSAEEIKADSIPLSLFDRANLLVACDPRFGYVFLLMSIRLMLNILFRRYLTAATIFRGRVASQEAEQSVLDLQRKNSAQFVEWIPDNVSVSLSSVPPVGQTQAATCLSNSTAVQELFKRTLGQVQRLFFEDALVHA